MISVLAFIVALPTLYALTSWALTGYDAVAVKPLDRGAAILALTGAIAAAAGAPVAYAT
ncbi:hypothetical protein [Caenispirillum salinarum]|uniref:hypothetical protein n=1 Tax=Caenispirillum salinarum TaxID=859058 RepID=UPI00384A77E3